MGRPVATPKPNDSAVTHRGRFPSIAELEYAYGRGRTILAKHFGWNDAYAPDIDAQRLIGRAVAHELHPGSEKPDRDDVVGVIPALDPPASRLDDLARCWRVEAARVDLNGLWDNVVADERNDALYEQWRAACVAAAEAAVAVWRAASR